MIEINLLPDNFRADKYKRFAFIKLKARHILIFGLFAIFLYNISLPLSISFDKFRLERYKAMFSAMLPQVKQIDEINSQINSAKALNGFAADLRLEKIALAPKLNFISDSLPEGIWIDSISFSGDVCVIKGRCVYSKGEEMSQLRSFLKDLNARGNFRLGIEPLELKSAQRKTIGPTEIIDFLISSKAGGKQPKKPPKKKKSPKK